MALANQAYVTLATNDTYAAGAIILAASIIQNRPHLSHGEHHPIVCLISRDVSGSMQDRMRDVFDALITVESLQSNDSVRLALLNRPELGITFTKIHIWHLVQYEKVVFLDADALVIQNIDELFDYPELSAAPDIGWPDCFNSGVFVCTPNMETFNALVEFAQQPAASFDGGDQGLLNNFFSDWWKRPECRLPYIYNVVPATFYSYLPAYERFKDQVKVAHFIGATKPWNARPAKSDSGLLNKWWSVYDAHTSSHKPFVHEYVHQAASHPASSGPRTVPDFSQYKVSWEDATVPVPVSLLHKMESRISSLEGDVETVTRTLKDLELALEKKGSKSE